MATDIVLEERAARVTDGDLLVEGEIRAGNNTVKINTIGVRVGGNNERSIVQAGRILTDKIVSDRATAKTIRATEIEMGTGTSGEPRDPGVLTLADGQGDETVRIEGKNGNIELTKLFGLPSIKVRGKHLNRPDYSFPSERLIRDLRINNPRISGIGSGIRVTIPDGTIQDLENTNARVTFEEIEIDLVAEVRFLRAQVKDLNERLAQLEN